MYNILIVDPILSNRIKMKKFISESDLDFIVTNEAASAEEALSIVSKNIIHLIISDNILPKKSGIQLFYELQEKNPSIKVILFTDYNHFPFSQDALTKGIIDFLFTPIRKNDLIKSLIHAHKVLEENRKRINELTQLRKEYNNRIEVFKDRFLINLIHGHLENDLEITGLFDYFNIKYFNSYTIAIVQIDDYNKYNLAMDEDEKQFLIFKVYAVLETSLSNMDFGIAFISRFDKLTMILTKEISKEDLWAFCREIQEKLINSLSISATIGIGETFSRPSLISVSYKQARAALRHNFYLGKGSIIHINYVESNNEISYFYPIKKEELLVYEAVNGNESKVLKLVDEVFHCLFPVKMIPEKYYPKLILDILISINRIASEQQVPLESFFNDYVDIKEINTKVNPYDAHKYMKEILSQICEYQNKKRFKKEEVLLHKVKDYIYLNYNKKISIKAIALFNNTTPQYIEELIQRSFKVTFYEYCMKIKIDKAKELLKNTSLTTLEIANMIGFSNVEYFIAMFKQHTHLTPIKYKQSSSK